MKKFRKILLFWLLWVPLTIVALVAIFGLVAIVVSHIQDRTITKKAENIFTPLKGALSSPFHKAEIGEIWKIKDRKIAMLKKPINKKDDYLLLAISKPDLFFRVEESEKNTVMPLSNGSKVKVLKKGSDLWYYCCLYYSHKSKCMTEGWIPVFAVIHAERVKE